MTNREEEVIKEDDQDILSKGENSSERENAENESRSVKLGANVENPASALSQQPPLEQVIVIVIVIVIVWPLADHHCPLPGGRI